MTNTNTTNKVTYVSAINFAIEAIRSNVADSNDEYEATAMPVIEKLVALGQQLEKRNSAKSGKPTKKQTENAEVKQAILDTLLVDEGKRCGDIATEIGITGQKCSALLSQMVKAGEVVKREGEKRVSLFFRSTGEEVEGE